MPAPQIFPYFPSTAYLQPNTSPMQIILRRFRTGPNSPLTFEPLQIGLNQQDIDINTPCSISGTVDNDICFYAVDIPGHLFVQPVDWRRFAYDHRKIQELLNDCIHDNVVSFGFAENVTIVPDEIQQCLEMALNDLSSVVDLNAVECDSPSEGQLQVTVDVDHKNGERANYVFAIQFN